ncbi:hypothetical protein B0T11DRAFT_29508 [Plectosphaerella cucumerina]|uniref:Uncharacterized protein n=1 Tax=Plectosphaerella cucumerina TaxID=40658 RepID=A0A8K0TWN0_9PEZI|nr:hypothetical protein B0T11DRAFT_128854 [Plectosphaerella cucumerina]KAH7377233.1 hypothetical protein B0T11DRAFT_29508 [Plectosphaerella cucumerina]
MVLRSFMRPFTVHGTSRAVCSYCRLLATVILLWPFSSPAVIQSRQPFFCGHSCGHSLYAATSRAVCSHCQCLSAVIHLRSFNSPAVIQSGRPWSCSRCSLTAGWRQILQRIRTPGPGREGRDWS